MMSRAAKSRQQINYNLLRTERSIPPPFGSLPKELGLLCSGLFFSFFRPAEQTARNNLSRQYSVKKLVGTAPVLRKEYTGLSKRHFNATTADGRAGRWRTP